MSHQAENIVELCTIALCRFIAPFDRPVVPDVYVRTPMSPGSGCVAGGRRPAYSCITDRQSSVVSKLDRAGTWARSDSGRFADGDMSSGCVVTMVSTGVGGSASRATVS
jgi:hypothetical protein